MKVWVAALALAIALVALAGCTSNGAAQQKAAQAQTTPVRLEFLYAPWCGHCTAMKPVVEKVASEFPGLVDVKMVDEAERKTDPAVAALYQKYKAEGKFGGFPTIVANGNDSLVGERTEVEFRQWLCGQFDKKPAGC